jgi:hypothetical protein
MTSFVVLVVRGVIRRVVLLLVLVLSRHYHHLCSIATPETTELSNRVLRVLAEISAGGRSGRWSARSGDASGAYPGSCFVPSSYRLLCKHNPHD